MASKALRPTRPLTVSRIMASLCSMLGSGFAGSADGACACGASGSGFASSAGAAGCVAGGVEATGGNPSKSRFDQK
jgi:hypothetical protein